MSPSLPFQQGAACGLLAVCSHWRGAAASHAIRCCVCCPEIQASRAAAHSAADRRRDQERLRRARKGTFSPTFGAFKSSRLFRDRLRFLSDSGCFAARWPRVCVGDACGFLGDVAEVARGIVSPWRRSMSWLLINASLLGRIFSASRLEISLGDVPKLAFIKAKGKSTSSPTEMVSGSSEMGRQTYHAYSTSAHRPCT